MHPTFANIYLSIKVIIFILEKHKHTPKPTTVAIVRVVTKEIIA